MTKPRSHYVDAEIARYYHVTSRCVQRAWLFGKDPLTGKNHNHRKPVFLNRMHDLAQFFAVEIMGYAVMSNHFHIVLHYDPLEHRRWSDEDVALRWVAARCAKAITGERVRPLMLDELDLEQRVLYHALLLDPMRLQKCRRILGSLSCYMQYLKQPFAAWANGGAKCTGHFFEQRFYSGVLLTEEDLLTCMAYVDLNPVEAGIAASLKEAENTSIHERLEKARVNPDHLEAYLSSLEEQEAGVPSTSTQPKPLAVTLRKYAEQLGLAVDYLTHPGAEFPNRVTTWMARILNRKKRKRATAAFYDYA